MSKRPVRERVMLGAEALIGPFCPLRWSYNGQSGFGGRVTRLPVFAGCFGQPALSGGASSWHRQCAIPQAAFGVQPAPALFPSPQGLMTGAAVRMIPSRW